MLSKIENKNNQLRICLLFFLILACGCATIKEEESAYEERILTTIYNNALNKLINKEYEDSSLEFDEVERQHPYSPWAKKAIIMSSYSNYKNAEYFKAEANLKRFINLYPASEYTSYAQYLLAMCYYQQIIDVKRDQASVFLAYDSFKLILDRYPNTDYAKESYYKIIYLENHIAARELRVGLTYISLKKYISALKRFKNIVNNYQTTIYVPEALHRMVEIYLALGIKEEALLNSRVLGYNFPKSKWYKFSYKLLRKNNIIYKQNR